jgi:predicted adenine nucleotide alpha hydrolase (AANH) superfamily ATPase
MTENTAVKAKKTAILLHSCCGPCSTSASERLLAEHEVTLFFYNPNITDPLEHERRRDEQLRFLEAFNARARQVGQNGLAHAEAPYEPWAFIEAAAGMEDEKEGGARCRACFILRLDKTAAFAAREGYDGFTTTLSVSPHKDFHTLRAVGEAAAARRGTRFLAIDFKKRDGFRRSLEMSKEYGLYRQNYCGCDFSRR